MRAARALEEGVGGTGQLEYCARRKTYRYEEARVPVVTSQWIVTSVATQLVKAPEMLDGQGDVG